MSEIEMMFPGNKPAEKPEAKKDSDHAKKLHRTKIHLAAIIIAADHAGRATGAIKTKAKPQASKSQKKPVMIDKGALRG